MIEQYDIVVIGGGAAGFFFAIQCKERNPAVRIVILEKSNKYLSKVKISGGGRCNVTHACFDPREMVENYPRGKKELLGPFHRFLCGDMMGWLDDQGVETKIEDDGRVFPASNKSQTIIDCFLSLCKKYNIEIRLNEGAQTIERVNKNYVIQTKSAAYQAQNLFIATGSSPASWKMIETLGHHIIPPVPSLFTFNIDAPLLSDLPGISVPFATIKINEAKMEASGPLLITHWGLSGPAILKLSAWGARELAKRKYCFSISVNWVALTLDQVAEGIKNTKASEGKQKLASQAGFGLPKRLWTRVLELCGLTEKNYASLTNKDVAQLASMLCASDLRVEGKSTFKDEFVTCGGVDTREINFKTMESKIYPGLYFGGEVIDIDAITGGFNFQAAWTEAYIAAEAIL